MYYWLQSRKPEFERIAMGNAIKTIGLSYFKKMVIPLPPLPEQTAIATTLSDVDALISSLDALISKKKQIKQGAMQELLSGKRRLPGFSGEWEVKRLGEFGSTYGGLTGKTKSDFGSGKAFYITFMNIMSNVIINASEFDMVKIGSNEKQNRVLDNDIFFNGSSETPEEVGLCAVLQTKVENVYLNSFCFGYRLHINESADGLFLAYHFRSNVGRELLKSLAQGATRYNLSKKALLKVAFPLPPLPEQQAIAAILSDMDAEITTLESRKNKTKLLKQGMMQELLTGRIRLIPPAAHAVSA
ncbi:MAG: restriction endonuclease subunit S [Acidithiobacillus ferrivorans]